MSGLTLLFCGSRTLFPTIQEISTVVAAVEEKAGCSIEQIIHGGAIGVDQQVGLWAKEKGVATRVEYPDYTTHGRGAPLVRNDKMADIAAGLQKEGKSVRCVAMWDGKSRGTLYMLRSASDKGLHVDSFVWQNARYVEDKNTGNTLLKRTRCQKT